MRRPSTVRAATALSTALSMVLAGVAISPGPATAAEPGAQTLGLVANVSQDDGSVTITTTDGAARVTFLSDDVLRVEADPGGEFTDPANEDPADPAAPNADIVVGEESFDGADVAVEETPEAVRLSTGAVTLEIDREPVTMTLRRADGSVVWRESAPLSFDGDSTAQTLARGADEQFLGGGMQNGRFSHRGETVMIERNFNWEDGGYPNAVPYYMSSAGYGVLRNTFAPGSYSFTEPSVLTHTEDRFDAYYFVGDYKAALDGYTALTGRPMMPPVYGLEYGDADCYNRSNPDYSSSGFPGEDKQRTPDALLTAQGFVEHDMPGGWMLVNDGYGCEYVELEETGDGLRNLGIELGLWTERALTDQEYEVAEAGVRIRKLDVAWVGQGYRQALSACGDAHGGIEEFSDARGFVLMVEAWAGAQRCAMPWTGDHAGTLDAIGWQIPALHGAGNSGFAFNTADVDGIFGGSPESYTRDLQWKALVSSLYSMSGWAAVDKQPWMHGEPYTSINRDYEVVPGSVELEVGVLRSEPAVRQAPGDRQVSRRTPTWQVRTRPRPLTTPVPTRHGCRRSHPPTRGSATGCPV